MASVSEYMQLATRVYAASQRNEIGIPDGWIEIDWQPDGFTGFSAGIYKNDQTGEIVISYTGTNDNVADPLNWTAGMGVPAPQIFEAMGYYLEFRKNHPEATNITFTGHSLGGGLASLMAVFFNKQATVFDEAPFQLAALSPSVLAAAAATMAASGYLDADMALFLASAGILALTREANVTQYFIEGEVLNAIRFHPDTLVGNNNTISLGNSTASMIERHSMALLTALRTSPLFHSAAQKLPDLITQLLDENLFAADSRNPDQTDLLRYLLRHQLGVEGTIQPDGMLDRFAADMNNIAQSGGLSMSDANITKALTAFAMQAYYDNRLAADATLFDTKGVTGGGLHFDRTHVADTLEGDNGVKGYDMYFKKYLETLPAEDHPFVEVLLPNMLDWFIQAGSGGMSATAGKQSAFMLGGSGNDILTGGSQADVLIGNGGADILSGGGSYDYLFGGAGVDTYIINSGDGNDTIVDVGRNILKINGEVFAGIFTKVEGSDSYLYTNGDQSYTLTFGSFGSSTLSISGNTSLIFLNQANPADFADGQFGLTLWENEAPTDFDLDLTGTEATNTSDLVYFAGESVAYFYGFSQVASFNPDGTTTGNWLYSENDLALDTPLTLSGGGGNDRLEGLLGADHLVGGDGNDVLWGVSGALLSLPLEQQQGDLLEGGAGIDLLCGGGGEDMVYGGEDTDILAAMAGNDLLMGERGDDLVVGCAGDDILSGGSGNDMLVGDGSLTIQAIALNSDPYAIHCIYSDGYLTGMTSEHMQLDTAFSADGDDRLFGGSGTDCLVGGLGNDQLSGDDDNDILWGDNDATSIQGGDDTLSGGGGDDLLYGGGGIDFLQGGSGLDELYGGEDNDFLYGEEGNDILWGDNPNNAGSGDDFLDGGAGNDRLFGGAGDDVYHFSNGAGADYIDDSSGQNQIRFEHVTSLSALEWMRCSVNSSGAAGYSQTGQDIMLRVNSGDTVVLKNGLLGNFSFQLGNGANYSWASFSQQVAEYRQYGEGNDAIASSDDDDRIYAGGGSDRVHGLNGNDAISGGNGFSEDFVALLRQLYPWLPENFSVDWAAGGAESPGNDNDALYGDDGNDILEGGAGHDQLFGGSGDDALGGGADEDILYGEDGDDILSGGTGGDWLYGCAGNDRIEGGDGDDLVDGGQGADYLDGGEGVDTVYYTDSDEGVTVDLSTGTGSGGDAAGDILVHIEKVLGSRHADTIIGDANDNQINGGGGQDILVGGDGDDVLGYFLVNEHTYSDCNHISPHAWTINEAGLFDGGNGNDTLFGGRYADILIGGAGNDILSGGMGHDILQGGDGDDVFTSGTTYETPDDLYLDIMEGGAGNDVYQVDIYSSGVDIVDDQKGSNVVQCEPSLRSDDSYPDLSSFSIGFVHIDMDQVQSLMTIEWSDSFAAEQQLTAFTTSLCQTQTWCPPDTFQDLYIASNGGSTGMVAVILGGRNVALDYTYDFGNSQVYSHADLLAQVMGRYQSPYFGEEDNVIRGDALSNMFWAGGGNDTFFGAGGNDTLYGECGDDALYGNEGDDCLIGGIGNDFLHGGAGNDVYVFNRGDGQDVLNDLDQIGSMDTLRFGEDIADSDILAIALGGDQDDLLLRVKNSTDQVRIESYFAPAFYGDGEVPNSSKLERIEFANGVVWDAAMMQSIMVTNQAPRVNGLFLVAEAIAGNPFSLAVPGDILTDPDTWDSLTYAVRMADGTSLPSWLRFDANKQTFSGSPTTEDVGRLELVVSVCDSCGASAEQAMQLDVLPANRVPEVNKKLDDTKVAWGEAFNYTIAPDAFFDADGDSLTYSATLADGRPLPTWLTFDPINLCFTGQAFSLGTNSVLVTVTDAESCTVSDSFDLTVVKEPTLVGTENSDFLRGGLGNDVLLGLQGNDTLRGGEGADLLDGGEGLDAADYRNSDDGVTVDLSNGVTLGGMAEGDVLYSIEKVYGSDFHDSLTGSAENNVLIGYGGNDQLFGLSGNDTLRGEDGEDSLFGGAGNDILRGGEGADLLNGGEGMDTADYRDSEGGVIINLATGRSTGGTAEGDVFLSIEKIQGSNARDILIGSSVNNILIGNGGNDLLFGLEGNDTLRGENGMDTLLGGVGNDTLRGGAGADFLLGGNGIDTADYRDSADGVIINMATGRTSGGTAEGDILFSIEKIQGSNTRDILIGSAEDTFLLGNGGDDVLGGGLGNDTLIGGAGHDIFLFDTPLSTTANKDRIGDFVPSQDLFHLDRDIFTSLFNQGRLSSELFCANASGCALDDNDYILYNTSSGALLYDADGSGQGDALQFATLTNKPEISANDFLVVA